MKSIKSYYSFCEARLTKSELISMRRQSKSLTLCLMRLKTNSEFQKMFKVYKDKFSGADRDLITNAKIELESILYPFLTKDEHKYIDHIIELVCGRV